MLLRQPLLAQVSIFGLPSQSGKPGRNSLVNEGFPKTRWRSGRATGTRDPLQELAQQSSEDENRLKKLIQQESKLDELQRDVIADEAVFSSTLGKLNVIRSNYVSSYPYLQKLTEPTLPMFPSSPRTEFV